MKSNKKALLNQREIIEAKVHHWMGVAKERMPPSGWISAIRGALGMTARQLGERLGVDHSGILRLEKREQDGAVTIEMMKRAAAAMNCKLVYAIVPQDHYESLNSIIDEQALKSAKKLAHTVEHSMRLEKQGVASDLTERQILKLADELKANFDPLLWGQVKVKKVKTNE